MGKTPQRVTELLKREFEGGKISKYMFCKQTGINPTSVERYLYGVSEPTQTSLEKLSAYFKVPVAWLRGDAPGDFENARILYEIAAGGEKYVAEHATLCAEINELVQYGLDVEHLKAIRDYIFAVKG